MNPRVCLVRPKRQIQEQPPRVDIPLRGNISTRENSSQEKIKQAQALAESLTDSERRELIAQLSLDLDSKHDPKSRDVEMWSGALHSALQEALGGALGATVGVMTFKSIVAPLRAWQPIAEFMSKSRLSEAQVNERQALYCLLAELVVAYARKVAKHTGAPLSAKFVVNCSANVAGIFDSAFPGYLAAGLAPVVAKRFKSGSVAHTLRS